MSRKHRDELEFGADSFLDVVANIVGILIILIVVVGMKVSRAPVVMAAPAPVDEVATPVLVEIAPEPGPLPELEPDDLEELPALEWDEEIEFDIAMPEFPPLPARELPPELAEHEEALRREQARLTASLERLTQEAETLRKAHAQAILDAEQQRQTVADTAGRLQQQRQRLAQLEADTARERRELDGILRQITEDRKDPPGTQKLTHRLPPIGRVVTGDEMHFMLRNNRVSRVPMKDLTELVHRDITRRKEILLRRPFYQGNVGPVEGYQMEYMLQRQTGSVLDELQSGRGMIRIAVTGWVIRPTEAVHWEHAARAQQLDSSFFAALHEAGPTATVTFWVYPDSFEIHQQLKQLAHETGYWVASRPLPLGVPIAGSPQGSRSMAQ